MVLVGSTRVEGLRETVRALERLGVSVDDIKTVMSAIAQRGAELAAQYAPERSGRLRASIRGNRAKGNATVTAGRARVRYAGPINYGWPARHIRAVEFMQDADRKLASEAPEMLAEGIEELVRKANLG